jgi:hypothetical protein
MSWDAALRGLPFHRRAHLRLEGSSAIAAMAFDIAKAMRMERDTDRSRDRPDPPPRFLGYDLSHRLS